MDDTVGHSYVKYNCSPIIPAKAGMTVVKTYKVMQLVRKTIAPSFLRKQEPIRLAANASLPDGFLLSQE